MRTLLTFLLFDLQTSESYPEEHVPLFHRRLLDDGVLRNFSPVKFTELEEERENASMSRFFHNSRATYETISLALPPSPAQQLLFGHSI